MTGTGRRVLLADLMAPRDVAAYTGLSELTIRHYVKGRNANGFPAPVWHAHRTPVYLRADIDAWLQRLPYGRGGPGKPRPSRRLA